MADEPEPTDFRDRATATATVSSLKSEDSTEQLICKTPQKVNDVKEPSVTKATEVDSVRNSRKLVVFLGLAQVVLGALLVGAGAVAVVKGAALSRVGAGLWAGCVAVVAGVVGVLAGINDCYGLNRAGSGSPLLTAFLALSLLCLACGNSAAVLAATGLHRDSLRPPPAPATFDDEMQAWTPVLTNIALLIIAVVHCLVCILTIYQLSKRVCPCFRRKQPFDHNQFDPTFKAGQPYVVHVDEMKRVQDVEKVRNHELCKELEKKLQGGTLKKKKQESPEFGSANSKEKLVTRWLGRQPGTGGPGGTAGRARQHGVRKPRKPGHAPVVLLPAHPASTLGRMPAACVAVAPRYATLPLPPYAPHATHAPLYYPVHDTRLRRRRSPRGGGAGGAAGAGDRRRRAGRERDQLARSLERIHRKRRDRGISDADLKRTYTGLDRAYAEQFIAVCDSTRHAAEQNEQHDSLVTTTSDSSNTHGDLP